MMLSQIDVDKLVKEMSLKHKSSTSHNVGSMKKVCCIIIF